MKVKIIICIITTVLRTFALENTNYELKQVVILSRHNIRTPLADNLAEITPKIWPKWKEKSGDLTEKGAMLEGFMGEFFYLWLNKIGLLPCHCPNEEEFYAYANTKQRTKASAKAFVEKAFPNCNVTVHYICKDENDPVFNAVLHNDTEIYRNIALEEMESILKSLHLNSAYEEIQKILDYKHSKICRDTKQCDLVTGKNEIIGLEPGLKPYVTGPLKIAKSSVDAFIMENYQGFPKIKVAWGELRNDKKWEVILPLISGYYNVIFNATLLARDMAEPLIKYMLKIFISETPKVYLVMGHDSNIYTVLKAMNFKSFSLQNQYEIIPIGSKIVFQRWFHIGKQEDYLKIEYVYSSVKQMREGIKLSLRNPPEFTLLELNGCKTDSDGFCPWNDFLSLLNNLYQQTFYGGSTRLKK